MVVRARRRPLRERLAAVALPIRPRLLVAVAVVAAAGSVLAGVLLATGSVGQRSSKSLGGPQAAVAAAYRYPVNCLTVTISASDTAYARAALDRASPCWRYGAYATVIFHRVAGRWREVLDSAGYSCPVASLPAVVQAQLGVCPSDAALSGHLGSL